MTTAAEATLTIGEVSEQTGLSTHTLRFYEQEGLLLNPVRRNSAGRRVFTHGDVGWLRVCTKLRASGMPIPDMRRYTELTRQGAGTEGERFEILRRHEERVQRQVADLQDVLGIIQHKVAMYAEAMTDGTAQDLWRDGPSCAVSTVSKVSTVDR